MHICSSFFERFMLNPTNAAPFHRTFYCVTQALMVLSSHLPGTIPTTDKGGWYLEECAHPYHQFTSAGYEITLCSIQGGDATKNVDPQSLKGFDNDKVKAD
jgi:hypothetical protein